MEKLLLLLMYLCLCNGLVRKLPVGEFSEDGKAVVKLRMPGIVPQKVTIN